MPKVSAKELRVGDVIWDGQFIREQISNPWVVVGIQQFTITLRQLVVRAGGFERLVSIAPADKTGDARWKHGTAYVTSAQIAAYTAYPAPEPDEPEAVHQRATGPGGESVNVPVRRQLPVNVVIPGQFIYREVNLCGTIVPARMREILSLA